MSLTKNSWVAFVRFSIVSMTIMAVCLFGIGFLFFLQPQIVLTIVKGIGVLVMGFGCLMLLSALITLLRCISHSK